MPQINKPTDYFNTVLYTGTNANQSITGVGFQPDWVWLKSRNNAQGHFLYDAVRGVIKSLDSSSTASEQTYSDSLTSFDSDGFTFGGSSAGNANSYTYTAWNWLGGGTASSNTDGSITSSVSANTTAGFSIVSYTGTGANATVGHGLGTSDIGAIIFKNRDDGTRNWKVYHKALGATKQLNLNLTLAATTETSSFNDTEPTSSVFSIGTSTDTNKNTDDIIAYCFAEKKGYSKFGSYTGNGSTDGTFVYTGFKPAFVLLKSSSSTYNWHMYDDKRQSYNDGTNANSLRANTSDAEDDTTHIIDILSNGFKLRNSNPNGNSSGATYIYMAFAENPLVGTNNIPATAR